MPSAKQKTATVTRKSTKAKTPPKQKRTPPSLRFYLSTKLQKRLLASLAKMERSDDATEHHIELAEMIVELTNEGLNYYFLRSLKLAHAGFIVQQSANIGILAVQRLAAPVIRNIVGRLGHEQLLSVASTIRELQDKGAAISPGQRRSS